MNNSNPLTFAPIPMNPIPKAKKKDIVYGPAPKHLVESVRKELRRLVELPDLDANLGQIARFAHQADDMLMCVKSPEAVMRDEHNVVVPGVVQGATNAETYGAAVIRQIIPAIAGYQKAQNETPGALVDAIASARRMGMTDVAAELEKKLVGKSLDGERPIDVKPVSVADYLPPKMNNLPPNTSRKPILLADNHTNIFEIEENASVRLCKFLSKHNCKTVADAKVLLMRPVWRNAKKIQKELLDILNEVLQ